MQFHKRKRHHTWLSECDRTGPAALNCRLALAMQALAASLLCALQVFCAQWRKSRSGCGRFHDSIDRSGRVRLFANQALDTILFWRILKPNPRLAHPDGEGG